MAAPRRERIIWRLLCTAVLAVMEYAVITIAVLPMTASTALDWYMATLVIAPMATAGLLVTVMVPARIVADVLAFFSWLGRRLTGERR